MVRKGNAGHPGRMEHLAYPERTGVPLKRAKKVGTNLTELSNFMFHYILYTKCASIQAFTVSIRKIFISSLLRLDLAVFSSRIIYCYDSELLWKVFIHKFLPHLDWLINVVSIYSCLGTFYFI